MHWFSRRSNYDIVIPPLDKHIYELNESEAADYFAWYIDILPQRVEYLSKICSSELRISQEFMDCTSDSLVLLWKWFLRRAKTESIKAEEQQYNDLSQRSAGGRQLTLETEYIIRDIGMYLGETFRKNNANIVWSFYTKPKRDFFVNHPLLTGFVDRSFGTPCKVSFEPIHMSRIQALKIINRSAKDTDLQNLYMLWSSKI